MSLTFTKNHFSSVRAKQSEAKGQVLVGEGPDLLHDKDGLHRTATEKKYCSITEPHGIRKHDVCVCKEDRGRLVNRTPPNTHSWSAI